ncbi:MAG: rod-binding protein [Hyphomicrobiaceae bacterium]
MAIKPLGSLAQSGALRPNPVADPVAGAKAAAGKAKAATDFQAVILRTMVEQMLPAKADHVFGSGTAGSVWRSMLAEKIAAQMASRDVLGLDKMLSHHIDALSAAKTPLGGGKVETE